jgi:DNA-binding NarL/FixJ family response regulator
MIAGDHVIVREGTGELLERMNGLDIVVETRDGSKDRVHKATNECGDHTFRL